MGEGSVSLTWGCVVTDSTNKKFEDILAMRHAQDADLEFSFFIKKLPENYWAKYDLSAVRLGWELCKLKKCN